MFIIEGADNLGKTTAAKRLVELARLCEYQFDGRPLANQPKYPVYYSHMSRPNDAFDFLHDYKDMSSVYAVQDRFHLGGMVWHDKKINQHSLQIIQGRLMAMASVIVVFYYSGGPKAYEQYLLKDDREHMFERVKMLTANERFKELADGALHCHVDITYDIHRNGFPTDAELQQWLGIWHARLSCLQPTRSNRAT